MKVRHVMTAVAVFALATSSWAQLSKAYKDFGDSAVQFLMTKEEAAQWKAVKNDAEAANFIRLFWARRDPTPGTPTNEYENNIKAAMKYADEHFSQGKVKGSLSDRGKVLVVFGVPSKIERTAPESSVGNFSRPSNESSNATQQGWVWEGDRASKLFGIPRAQIDFIDSGNNGSFRMLPARFDFGAASEHAIEATIVRPNLTLADLDKPVAQQAPPPPAAPAGPVTAFKTAAFETAVGDAKAGKTPSKATLETAEFVSPSGDFYIPVALYIPKGSGIDAATADTFFMAVDDAAGKRLYVVEKPATLKKSHDNEFEDETVTVPASGKYVVTAGLAKAGVPVTVASMPLDVNVISKDASGTSKLILTNDIFELPDARPEKAAFAFGKLQIAPKPDMTFTNQDDLNYFVEVHNPGIDAATNGPKLQMGIDLLSKGQTISRLPLSEVLAGPLSGKPGPGQYVISDAIPLSKMSKPLPPGDYTMKMKIVDTVTKQSYTVEQAFRIAG